ncbi:hypothetical protein ACFL25_00380 [Patescibacteria group bacterium]
MDKEKLAAILGIPTAVGLAASLSQVDIQQDARKAAADIFSRELDSVPTYAEPLPPELAPPSLYEPATIYQNPPIDINLAQEDTSSLYIPREIDQLQNLDNLPHHNMPSIVEESPITNNNNSYEEGDLRLDNQTNLQADIPVSQTSTAKVPISQERTVYSTSSRGQSSVIERHEQPAYEIQPTYQDQKEIYQPSQEAVDYLAQALSIEIGNNPDNWEIRVRNALSFADYLIDNPQIIHDANNFSPTPEQIEQMKNTFQELQREYEAKGDNASKRAKIIALGVQNGQLSSEVFSELGAPLEHFDIATFLQLWGVEATWLITIKDVPDNWHKTAMVTNPFKGIPVGVATRADYDPDMPEHAIGSTIINARYFQYVIMGDPSYEPSDIVKPGTEWLDKWNPASPLWYERMRQYRRVLEKFVQGYPEYTFLFENLVEKTDLETVAFSRD